MDDEKNEVNESQAEYVTPVPGAKRIITFFNSFEEAELHGLKEMAAHTYEERLANLEVLRKRTYRDLLSPDGHWPPMKRIITITKGTIA